MQYDYNHRINPTIGPVGAALAHGLKDETIEVFASSWDWPFEGICAKPDTQDDYVNNKTADEAP